MNPFNYFFITEKTSRYSSPGRLFALMLQAFLLCSLVFIQACVAPVKNTSFIESEPDFNFLDEKDARVRISEEVSELSPPDVIYISPVSWNEENEIPEEWRKELSEFLREYFYQGLLYRNFHDMIILKRDKMDLYDTKEKRAAKLNIAVTRISKGNGLLRYFVGYTLGSTDLQVEGNLVSLENGEEILAFAARRRHAGNAYNGMNPRALSGKYCLEMSMEKLSIRITDAIRHIWTNTVLTGTPYPDRYFAWSR